MEDNVICLRSYRALKESRNLFKGYRERLWKMETAQLKEELNRYREERKNFPTHLLTLVKGQILMERVCSLKYMPAEALGVIQRESERINQALLERVMFRPLEPPKNL